MVMEEAPNPQSVGREFVRQYYTLLHQAPLHLHRFYSNNSSFVHGGLGGSDRESNPGLGQREIHQRIMQLNFRDCHAKIHQVDSLSTLGNGVVVQVIGELSNNGQPMRRFTQTFVLASQSPNKYYVHNDIFRYQDQIFSEEEPEVEAVLSEEEEPEIIEPEPPAECEISSYQQPAPEPLTNGSVQPDEVKTPFVPNPFPPTQTTPFPSAQTTPFPPSQPSYPATSQPPTTTPFPPSATHPPSVPFPPSSTHPPGSSQSPSIPIPAFTPPANQPVDEPLEEKFGNVSDDGKIADEKVEEQQIVSNEPKTYANLLRGGPGSFVPTSPVNPVDTSNQQQSIRDERRDSGFNRGGGMRSRGNNMNRMRDRGRNMEDTGEMDRRRPTNITYPDNQQLFVGNLPHYVGEEELKQLFQRYGNVLEVRINKPSVKGSSIRGGGTPNYCFVVFEEEPPVHAAIASKPKLQTKNGGELRLNLEEKKPKTNRSPGIGDNRQGDMVSNRPVSMGGRGGMGNRGGNRGGRGNGYGGNRSGGPTRANS